MALVLFDLSFEVYRERTCEVVIPPDSLGAIFALETADYEMTLCNALKMLGEHYIEREATDCANDRHKLCSEFLTHLKTKP